MVKGHIVLKDKEHAKKCLNYLLSLGYKCVPGALKSHYINNAFSYNFCSRKEYKYVFVVEKDGYIYTDSSNYYTIKKKYPIEIKYVVNYMDIE